MATNLTEILIHSIDDLGIFADQLSKLVSPPMIIGLNGDMGSGKTTFVRTFGQIVKSTDWINSPTYSIIQRYNAPNYTILHVDLYRTNGDNDIDHLDIPSQLSNTTIAFIEWIDKTTLLKPDIELRFSLLDDNKRVISLKSNSKHITDAFK
jgi:tRNA threonylcarbamoyladenosine biosynthesis protein TsaE